VKSRDFDEAVNLLKEAGFFVVRDGQAVYKGAVCDLVPFMLVARSGPAFQLRPVEAP